MHSVNDCGFHPRSRSSVFTLHWGDVVGGYAEALGVFAEYLHVPREIFLLRRYGTQAHLYFIIQSLALKELSARIKRCCLENATRLNLTTCNKPRQWNLMIPICTNFILDPQEATKSHNVRPFRTRRWDTLPSV